jgi:hypothetical protein
LNLKDSGSCKCGAPLTPQKTGRPKIRCDKCQRVHRQKERRKRYERLLDAKISESEKLLGVDGAMLQQHSEFLKDVYRKNPGLQLVIDERPYREREQKFRSERKTLFDALRRIDWRRLRDLEGVSIVSAQNPLSIEEECQDGESREQ